MVDRISAAKFTALSTPTRVAQHSEVPMSSAYGTDSELWQVQLESGEIGRMNLDTLDAAYNAGAIDESTLVLGPGETFWVKLGEAIGAEAEEVSYVSPFAESIPPVAGSIAPTSMAPTSLRPMVSEVSTDELFSSRKRSKAWIGWAIGAAAALAIFGVAGKNVRDSLQAKRALDDALIAAAASPVVEAREVAAAPGLSKGETAAPTPEETKATDAALMAAKLSFTATDLPDAKADPKGKHGVKSKTKGHKKHQLKGVFHKGGDPHDPLNASL